MRIHQPGYGVIEHGIQLPEIDARGKKRAVRLIFQHTEDVVHHASLLLGCEERFADVLLVAAVEKMLHIGIVL